LYSIFQKKTRKIEENNKMNVNINGKKVMCSMKYRDFQVFVEMMKSQNICLKSEKAKELFMFYTQKVLVA
jgi:uncharacterized Zn-finger protein